MDKQAYTVKEFCQLFSISPAHLYKLNKEGAGPPMVKVGRRTLIPGPGSGRMDRIAQHCSRGSASATYSKSVATGGGYGRQPPPLMNICLCH